MDYEKRVIEKSKQDPKTLFCYIRSQQKAKAVVGPLEMHDRSLTQTEDDMAQVLQDFFQSVFVDEVEGLSPEFPVLLEDDRALGDVNITIETVYKELMNLNPHKAAGPDGIKHIVLKSCAKSLALALHIMFRKTVDQRRLPNEWKTAKITALFKKGSRKKANNYRPVSLASQICKVMERIIRKQVTKHLQHNSLMSKHQHGFTIQKSCQTNLLETFRLDRSTGYTPWIRCAVS